MILKSFDFQCDFDFQITTSRMILILNHLYLGDLILIIKSSTLWWFCPSLGEDQDTKTSLLDVVYLQVCHVKNSY